MESLFYGMSFEEYLAKSDKAGENTGFNFPAHHTPSIAYKQIYINPVENNRMKILLFCKFSILFISVLLPQSAFAQDYIRWGLPEGATARLGKGSILNIAYSPDGARLAVASSSAFGSTMRMPKSLCSPAIHLGSLV